MSFLLVRLAKDSIFKFDMMQERNEGYFDGQYVTNT